MGRTGSGQEISESESRDWDVDQDALLRPTRLSFARTQRILRLEQWERGLRVLFVAATAALVIVRLLAGSYPAAFALLALLAAGGTWFGVTRQLTRARREHREAVRRATAHIQYVKDPE